MSNENKISLDEARYLILKKYPNMKPINAVDYDVFYVFTMIPKDYGAKSSNILYDNMKAVRKDDGRILTFNPLDHNAMEYARAVQEKIMNL